MSPFLDLIALLIYIDSIPAVLAAGKKHAALRGDLYGNLYFYLSEQLTAFAERIAKLDITFHIFCKDASDLSRQIHNGIIPSPRKFDRVEVSNIMDHNYLGIPVVVADWGSLLKRSQYATLLGYFMNWQIRQVNAHYNNSDNKTTEEMMKAMQRAGRVLVFHLSNPCPELK